MNPNLFIDQILLRGYFHENTNEDFLIHESLGNGEYLIAVMDGCSMGKESHFSSTLIGKSLRFIAKGMAFERIRFQEENRPEASLKRLCRELFPKLRSIQNELGLEVEELLSTLIIGVLNSRDRSGTVLVVGDGVVVVDGEIHEFDQGDKPDYLGYHVKEEFDAWYIRQSQWLRFESFSQVSIATDGVLAFRNLKDRSLDWSSTKVIRHLLPHQNMGFDSDNLKSRIKELNNQDLISTDDLAIISVSLKEFNR